MLDGVSALSAQTISVTWHITASQVVTGYNIQRATSAGGPYTTIGQTGVGVTNFTDNGLSPNSLYYYRIVASNISGASAVSNVKSATTKQQSLAAPQNAVAIVISNTHMLVTWSGGIPSGAGRTGGGVNALIEAIQGTEQDYSPVVTVASTASFTFYSSEPDTYQFRIKFVQGNNESPYATTNVVEITAPTKVFLPMIVR